MPSTKSTQQPAWEQKQSSLETPKHRGHGCKVQAWTNSFKSLKVPEGSVTDGGSKNGKRRERGGLYKSVPSCFAWHEPMLGRFPPSPSDSGYLVDIYRGKSRVPGYFWRAGHSRTDCNNLEPERFGCPHEVDMVPVNNRHPQFTLACVNPSTGGNTASRP
ncbi:hypothetical protein N658DRAFT_53262 [Parathielavia hyrcaniae]|uniref:Uncharacterized protein n=1 Tax=Parathielavia hyrcaniae TaxID=113614 RepID=A0AAN6Q3T1_9PEZI|nr:hypothetical protein N658DRAFT_53262 [Parathielavia hyrcaniae]